MAKLSDFNKEGKGYRGVSEKYIITDEDLNTYIANAYTQDDADSLRAELISIVRVSDFKSLNRKGKWVSLPKY